MSDLTARQQQILEVVDAHLVSHGYPPTVREIGEAVGLTSSSTVHAHLANLERLGHLKRDPTKPRALGVVGRDTAIAEAPASSRELPGIRILPLLGRIAAGAPTLAEQHVEDEIAVPEMLTASGDNFLLRIRGESMIDAGILDGDFVVIRRQPSCAEGEIVAALVDGEEATVKHLRHDGGRVRLDPANEAFRPFYPEQVEVLGKVVGVFRRL
ncbi:MAG TPA: transcriptional repressor LexA [Gaiellales bacterium]